MKLFRLRPLPKLPLLATSLCLTFAVNLFAQTNLPIVRVHSLDASASESGDIGVFTITRDGGGTNSSLDVFCHIGGTASNGVDYATLHNVVTIPAGAFSANVTVTPIADFVVELPETVELALVPSPTANVPTYIIGSPSNAVVTIFDKDFSTNNLPPSVRILSPTNGSSFPAFGNITICAEARDLDGYVATVEFFANDHSLGIRTNNPLSTGPANPFCLVWSNVPPGDFLLTAKATDDRGATGHSDPVHITVNSGMPVVTIFATDPHASEGVLSGATGTNIGTFTIYRSANTNTDLNVSFRIGGTASNGVDYLPISSSVLIPTGAFSATIVIRPLEDNLVEGTETVELSLLQPPCAAIFPPPPQCYQVGFPNSAVVFIEDNDRITNAPPKVHITSPTNGAVFAGPLSLPVTAEASDLDDDVVRVDFFANDHFLGSDLGTNKSPYSVAWSNALPGIYALQARAFDSRGAVGFSDAIRITITGTNSPPTNLPPVVTIFASDPIASEGTNFCRWYSNSTLPFAFPCTNTATFIVRRSGPTNSSLTLNYAIGGTASNGVDYVSIPGSVTIPAGERSARIVIVPIDDAIPECTETVILGLLEPTNIPPSYRVGWPGKAAAIIVDNDQPPPGTTTLCDGNFHLFYPAPTGFNYRLECSLDLVHWLPIGTNTVSDIDVHFVEPDSQEFPNRFYRVVPETSAPLQ